MPLNEPLQRKLRMALVGGSAGSFIGRVHSIAACLDNRAEMAAGAFSSDPVKSKASAPDYGIDPERGYGDYEALIDGESKLPDDERVDFISIATPNHTHFEIARAAVEAGFNVVCDKPLTLDLAEAESLLDTVTHCDVVFAVTHNYTGYPMMRQAREMILGGELGEINAIRAQYIQGWLRPQMEAAASAGAESVDSQPWRNDPAKSGAAGTFADVGTHAYNLGRYVTGLIPESISCHLKCFMPGRTLDDYGTAIVRYENGALGTLTASQITHGRENDFTLEIDGTRGSIGWRQENPNELHYRVHGKPHQIYTPNPNAPYINAAGTAASRMPPGHPEGFFEAFANIYTAAFDAMALRAAGQDFEQRDTLYPNIFDGVEGMYFLQQCVASSQQDGAWLPLKHEVARR